MGLSVDCEAIRNLADAYYHRWLPPSVMEVFAAHINQCPDCQKAVDECEHDLKFRLLKLFTEQEDDPEKVEEMWGRFILEGTVEHP